MRRGADETWDRWDAEQVRRGTSGKRSKSWDRDYMRWDVQQMRHGTDETRNKWDAEQVRRGTKNKTGTHCLHGAVSLTSAVSRHRMAALPTDPLTNRSEFLANGSTYWPVGWIWWIGQPTGQWVDLLANRSIFTTHSRVNKLTPELSAFTRNLHIFAATYIWYMIINLALTASHFSKLFRHFRL